MNERFPIENQNEEAEDFDPQKLTEREEQSLKKAGSSLGPRREYVKGIEKLNFSYTFSTGEVLRASENEEGIAQIKIFRDGQEVFDFDNLIPGSFITPTYYIKHAISMKDKVGFEGDWAANAESSTVLVGDMRQPREIFALLHEIGHILGSKKWKAGKDEYKMLMTWWEILNRHAFKNHPSYAIERAKLVADISKAERDAYAEALKIARKVKQEKGINLLEGFESLDDLQEEMYGSLLSYRRGMGKTMIASNAGPMKDTWEKIKSSVGLREKNYGAQEWKFLENQFDKNRLKRSTIEKTENGKSS